MARGVEEFDDLAVNNEGVREPDRLAEAKRQLSHGQPPAQVAAAVGLTDQAHLTRTFARRYGITPARYQRALQR